MNRYPRHRARFWASLALLLAFVSAQSVLAEHIHIEERAHIQCDLSHNHTPAPVSDELTYAAEDLAPLYIQQQAPAARDCQPERQCARGPPPCHLANAS